MYTAQETAEKIKETARQKGVKIKDMLSSCKLGINSISEMSKGKIMSSASLAKIAEYLDVSVDYLLGRTDVPAKEYIDDDDIKFALFGGDKEEITDEEFEDVKKFAHFILQKKRADKLNGKNT